MASCAGTTLCLWTVNGQPLARGQAPLRPGGIISCCCFFDVKDWDVQSLLVTGDTDGCVQVGLSKRGGAHLLQGRPASRPGGGSQPLGYSRGRLYRTSAEADWGQEPLRTGSLALVSARASRVS